MEALARAALAGVALYQPPERIRHVPDGHGARHPVAEAGIGAEAPAEADVDRLDDLVADVCRLTA